jgi:hypothetical protein
MYNFNDCPGGPAMSVGYRYALIAAAIVFSIVPSYAGPCLLDIDRMQASVDAVIAATAVAGPPGRQSTAAMTHRQPTPSSIAAAEAKLGEGERAKRALAAIAQARAADRAGDNSACERALADAQRAIGP